MVRTVSNEHISGRRYSNIFFIRKIRKQTKWNKEEDDLLLKYAKQFNEKNWKEVAKKFYNKNIRQCFSRYKRIKPGIKRGTWKYEEDRMILKLIETYGKAWSQISKELKTRTAKQIRDRYLNVLDPNINKNKFSYYEERKIFRLVKTVGTKWALIAKEFPHRTANMIKNRFYSSIKKRSHEYINEINGEDYQQELSDSTDISNLAVINTKEIIEEDLLNNLNLKGLIEHQISLNCESNTKEQHKQETHFGSVFETNFFMNEEIDIHESNYTLEEINSYNDIFFNNIYEYSF